MQTSRPSDMSVPGRLAAAVGAVSLTGLVALALVGCTGGELPGPRPQATVLVEQPAAGALVSAGTHDVVLLVHQAGEYTLGEVRAQVARLQAAQATLAPLPAGRVAMAVVTASAGTQLRQPLTADPAVSAAALAAAAALAPEGTATLADGLRAALAELGGERARREALPLVLHLAGAGPAVPLELAGELADAGVVVVHLGGEQAAAALWPPEHPGQLAIDPATLEVPGRRALSGVAARLLLSHDPLTVRVRTLAADRLRVRLLGEGGMALLDLEGKGPLFEAIADLPDGAELLPLQVHVQAWSARGGAASELRAEAIELPLVRPPAISMVEPARAVPGETVVLRGRFFSTRPDGNTIELGSMLVQPSVQAKHRLEFVLPEGAPDRQVRVLADDQPSAWATLRVDSDGDT
ncbi:MAG: hypothetical protein FJ125_02890, partial [Deltaproteobacteria bacterium]|nr:hypothetical protein [Deltaproteobacteria bacterium]